MSREGPFCSFEVACVVGARPVLGSSAGPSNDYMHGSDLPNQSLPGCNSTQGHMVTVTVKSHPAPSLNKNQAVNTQMTLSSKQLVAAPPAPRTVRSLG